MDTKKVENHLLNVPSLVFLGTQIFKMFLFISVSVHAAVVAVGHGLGCDETGGGMQDGSLHPLVALHTRSFDALRVEKGLTVTCIFKTLFYDAVVRRCKITR